jgi:hypothetical protein
MSEIGPAGSCVPTISNINAARAHRVVAFMAVISLRRQMTGLLPYGPPALPTGIGTNNIDRPTLPNFGKLAALRITGTFPTLSTIQLASRAGTFHK